MNASSWSARYRAGEGQQRRARDAEPRAPEPCRYPGCCAVQMRDRLHCAYHAALYIKACEKRSPGAELEAFLRRWGLL